MIVAAYVATKNVAFSMRVLPLAFPDKQKKAGVISSPYYRSPLPSCAETALTERMSALAKRLNGSLELCHISIPVPARAPTSTRELGPPRRGRRPLPRTPEATHSYPAAPTPRSRSLGLLQTKTKPRWEIETQPYIRLQPIWWRSRIYTYLEMGKQHHVSSRHRHHGATSQFGESALQRTLYRGGNPTKTKAETWPTWPSPVPLASASASFARVSALSLSFKMSATMAVCPPSALAPAPGPPAAPLAWAASPTSSSSLSWR